MGEAVVFPWPKGIIIINVIKLRSLGGPRFEERKPSVREEMIVR